jgi:DNA-directed RNA polymerase subunit E'/Rpb7
MELKTSKQKYFKSIYSLCQITKIIQLPIVTIGKNIYQTIENTISSMVEGKCIVEGYVKKGSVKIITYSSGLVKGSNIIFNVVFECEVCFPVAGMLLNCVCKNVTKAGIRADSVEETPSPFVLFIARDHFYANDYFNSIKENDNFVARVIAQRFELNDKYISIIAELVSKDKDNVKPKLVFED